METQETVPTRSMQLIDPWREIASHLSVCRASLMEGCPQLYENTGEGQGHQGLAESRSRAVVAKGRALARPTIAPQGGT